MLLITCQTIDANNTKCSVDILVLPLCKYHMLLSFSMIIHKPLNLGSSGYNYPVISVIF